MTLRFDPNNAELHVQTGVAGRSARLGHRLTLEPGTWRAEVEVGDGAPTSLSVAVDADSLEVVDGKGGLKPLSGPERAVATANAQRAMRIKKFPTIDYQSTSIEPEGDGFVVDGELTICGVTRPCRLVLTRDDSDGALATESTVRQTEFGIKPFSLMMGTLSVADDVKVVARAIP